MGARISFLIEYIPSGIGNINYVSTSNTLVNKGNNISAPQTIGTAHVGGIRPFILGISKLGGGDYFWGSPEKGDIQWDNNGKQIGGYYGGFWSGYNYRSNENGDIINPVNFQIIGTNIDHFVIRFDEALNEYATIINIDGIDYENIGGGMFTWQGSVSNIHNVIIRKWNKPNKQVKITSILIGLTIEYDRKYFRQGGRIVASSRQKIDNTKPSYGVVPQYGSFEATDVDGNLDELSTLGLLTDGLRCGIFMNAEPFITGMSFDGYTEANKDRMLANLRLAEVSFIGDNVSAELTDDILNWGATHQSGIENNESNTGLSFYEKLQTMTPNKVNVSDETKEYLSRFNFPDGYIMPEMLAAAWDTLCWVTGTRISKNRRGEIWLMKKKLKESLKIKL